MYLPSGELGMLKLFYFLIWMYVNKIGIYLDILSS